MSDNCPFLAAAGIGIANSGLRLISVKYGADALEIEDKRVIEICRNCPLERCILEVSLRGKSKEKYIKEQLKVKCQL